MGQQNLNFGATPDDPNAEALYDTFQKIQNNFDEFYGQQGISWTPTLLIGGSEGNTTYTEQSGKYWTMAWMVFFLFSVRVDALDGGLSGNVEIGGVPITPLGQGGSLRYFPAGVGSSGINFGDYPMLRMQSSQRIELRRGDTTASSYGSAVTEADINSSFILDASGFYMRSI